MPTAQSSFITALSKIDPTLGFVEYITATKPYHTKILEVSVEHIYAEALKVTITEDLRWQMFFLTPHISLLSAILNPHNAIAPVAGTLFTAGYQDIVFSPSITGATLVSGTTLPVAYEIDISVDGGAPQHIMVNGISITDFNSLIALINSKLVGATASIVGGNLRVTSNLVGLGSAILIVDVNATIYSCNYGNVWNPALNQFVPDTIYTSVNIISAVPNIVSPNANSFLIQPHTYVPFEIAVANINSNEFVFSKNYTVTGKDLFLNKWLVADPNNTLVTELTTGTFPKVIFISSDTGINGNGRYVVTGTPTWAAGTTSVQVVETISASANADGVFNRLMDNAIVLPIIAVTTGVNGTWTVAGNFTSTLALGKKFNVQGNGFGPANTFYTIVSSVFGGTNTVVTVTNIPVGFPVGATATGNIPIYSPALSGGTLGGELPQWRPGTAVQLSVGAGTLPVPTNNTATYYYQPTVTAPYFNLSNIRYAFDYIDYVDITTRGTGNFFVTRTETFIPGTTVDVLGTYLHRDDGKFTIKQTIHEGGNERVLVYQHVDAATPIGPAFDGTMQVVSTGFANPIYCPPAKSTTLHADTFIHESIKFEFDINLSDYMQVAYEENAPKGFGETLYGDGLYGPFGTYTPALDPYTAQTSGLPAGSTVSGSQHGAQTILPTGIDTQLFDLGGIDETLGSVVLFYNETSPWTP